MVVAVAESVALVISGTGSGIGSVQIFNLFKKVERLVRQGPQRAAIS